MNRFPYSLLVILVIASASLAACAPPAPEAQLEAAEQAVETARDDASSARDSLSSIQARLDSAETELREARRAVRDAEKRLLSAEARLERRATDVALFRKIQTDLLEAEPLRNEAVTVRVDDGIATLDGTVASDTAHQSALRIARSAPGVSAIRDRLEVESDEAS